MQVNVYILEVNTAETYHFPARKGSNTVLDPFLYYVLVIHNTLRLITRKRVFKTSDDEDEPLVTVRLKFE